MDERHEFEKTEEQIIEFKVTFPGEKNQFQTLHSFQEWIQKWIREEKVPGLEIDREKHQVGEQYEGMEVLDVLKVVLGSAALTAFTKGLFEWFKARRRRPEVSIEWNDVKIVIKDTDNPETLATQILSLIKNESGGITCH